MWYHPELKMALVEIEDGFAVGAVEEGSCTIGDILSGQFRRDEVEHLCNLSTGGSVMFHVEADHVSEGEANDLLGLLRD
ncbi:hypothetical protein [Luteibacter sp. ME-Dv--P-043b]|jgi:hypothetical protein|uniref:hypothetical protein n=1 Tax=unclassified Luteibacter TaxID=2620188 RepID=UPI00255245BA|nr:hypothetical protein [Luteibacter sp. ME-Dv--P-043b]